MRHYLAKEILAPSYSPVRVALAGCGGTGSRLLSDLSRLHTALVALGHPGLSLIAYDPDTVSESNIGRQLFSPSDIGLNKATVLITRINHFMGLSWDAIPARFSRQSGCQLVISAVDTVEARLDIDSQLRKSSQSHNAYWLDAGNDKTGGQVILGTFSRHAQPKIRDVETLGKLPCVTDLYDLTQVKEEEQGPSCSLAAALEHQDLMINAMIATCAVQILWAGFRQGYFTTHGCFVNLKSLAVSPLKVNRETWKRMGYKVRKPRTLVAV